MSGSAGSSRPPSAWNWSTGKGIVSACPSRDERQRESNFRLNGVQTKEGFIWKLEDLP
jgi:hypothetical protein